MRKPLVQLTANQMDMMEVCGFDLLAQVEALLRHAREYQRELQRVRHAAANSQAAAGVRRRVFELRQVCARLRETLDLITDTDRSAATAAPVVAAAAPYPKVGTLG
jgi:hypothetical protein